MKQLILDFNRQRCFKEMNWRINEFSGGKSTTWSRDALRGRYGLTFFAKFLDL